jgi:hypothetical protein
MFCFPDLRLDLAVYTFCVLLQRPLQLIFFYVHIVTIHKAFLNIM